MPKIPFDPPTLSRKDLPMMFLTFVALLSVNAITAAFIHQRFQSDLSFWRVLVQWYLATATGLFCHFLIMRPLRGMPPLFRKRPSDDFETWLTGDGFNWSRLRERYTTDELILVFGIQTVLLVALGLYCTRM